MCRHTIVLPVPAPDHFRARNNRTGVALGLALLLGATGLALAAEDSPLVAIQEELRQQQYLSGEPTGKLDEPTKAALKRFQIRNGLKVTGDVDAETLQLLAKKGDAPPAPSPAEVALNEVADDNAPPARERTRDLVISDREFLAREDSKAEAATAGDRPVQTPRVAADAQATAAPREPYIPPQGARTTDNPPVVIERRPPPPPIAERSTRVSRDSEPATIPLRRETETTTTTTRGQSEEPGSAANEVRRVVEDYLAAAEGPTPERELSFYADRVKYFDSGTVNHAFIAKDQGKYYRRWPERKFRLIGEPEVIQAGSDSATIKFRIRYSLRRGDDTASGGTENIVRLENTPEGYKIVSIRERKVSL